MIGFLVFWAEVSFILNVEQDEYLGSIDDVAGVVAVIHDQNTVPFPEDEGLTFHPGEAFSIGVTKVSWKPELMMWHPT